MHMEVPISHNLLILKVQLWYHLFPSRASFSAPLSVVALFLFSTMNCWDVFVNIHTCVSWINFNPAVTDWGCGPVSYTNMWLSFSECSGVPENVFWVQIQDSVYSHVNLCFTNFSNASSVNVWVRSVKTYYVCVICPFFINILIFAVHVFRLFQVSAGCND